MPEPSYTPGVDQTLNRLEQDDSRPELWSAIVEKLHLVCAEPNSKEARQRQMRSTGGEVFWLVTVKAPQEKNDWCIIWSPSGEEVVFTYVGPWPPEAQPAS